MKKYIFLLKYFIYKRTSFKFFKQLKSSQHLSKEELEIDNLNKFIKVYKYAFDNSQFYYKKYTIAGLNIDSIHTIQDIEKIPILTKKEVKDNLLSILTTSPSNKKLGKGATGGSTGMPMPYFINISLPVEAFAWRYLSWWDLKPWDDGAFIWRIRRNGKIENFLNSLAWWPVKKIRLDASFLNEEKMQQFAIKVNKLKPKLIQGYVGAVYEFALFLEKNNVDIYPPKAVWVTSAPLTKFQREVMERVFNAPVYNEYGCSEIPWIAAQCKERKGLHLNSEGRYFEIINTDKTGEGDVIITDLLNYYFPLIRYELGDRAKFIHKKCGCDINLPLIDEVKGRKGDAIIVPGIGTIDCSFLTTIFDDYPNSIKAFQLVQHKNYSLTLNVVPNYKHYSWEAEVNFVYSNLYKTVKNKLKIKLEYCTEILSDRGKSRFIIREK